MSIFSTLDFVTIESSSFHNSIPNLIYVSRRFCIHVILSWRPKNCTGALKNWNLGEKNLYTADLWSQNHTIYLPLNQVWCMSRKESLSYYIDQTMLVLLIDWYTNQLIGANQYILFSRGGHTLSDMFLPIGVLFVYDQIFLNVVSQIF